MDDFCFFCGRKQTENIIYILIIFILVTLSSFENDASPHSPFARMPLKPRDGARTPSDSGRTWSPGDSGLVYP